MRRSSTSSKVKPILLATAAAVSRARRRKPGSAGISSRTSSSPCLVPFPSCSDRSFVRPGGLTLLTGRVGAPSAPQQQSPAMNVVVCVKQIPDPAAPGKLDPETKTLVREGKLILDDSDAYGVEMALQLADAAGGGEVTLVSMAPNSEVSGLRTALAMGAAKAILVSDDALKGSDALGTAKVLAAAIKRVEGADLVLTATESSDGYTGAVPEELAELLGLPSVTFAKSITVDGGTVKVERKTDLGYDEVEAR